MTAVVAKMATITILNGYNTNAGTRVTRWRANPPSSGLLPAIDVRDTDRRFLRSLVSGGTLIREYELIVECICFAADGASTSDTLDSVVADVISAMLADETWGSLAISTMYDSDRKDVGQLDVKTGVSGVRFLIHYRKS